MKALARLHECTGLSEPSLVANVISTIISGAGSSINLAQFVKFLSRSSDPAGIFKQAEDKLRQTEEAKFRLVAEELVGTDPHQFLRAYSPGWFFVSVACVIILLC